MATTRKKKRVLTKQHRAMLLRIVDRRIREVSETVGELEQTNKTREQEDNPAVSLLEASGASHETECAHMLFSREGILLKALMDARQRLALGTYSGLCETCDLPISLARLKAIPETVSCIHHSAA